jgi:hypothetical protein
MHPKLLLLVVVPVQSFLWKDSSNEDNLVVVIIVIFFEVFEVAIHSCNPIVVRFVLLCWVSLKLVGKFNFCFLLEVRFIDGCGGTCGGTEGDSL